MTFREFIESRKAGDNPRGDAIRDTRRVFRSHPEVVTIADLSPHLYGACQEARDEMEKLFAAYRKEVGEG